MYIMSGIDYCLKGTNQSPIEIKSTNAISCSNKCNLLIYYRSSQCKISRSGRYLLFTYDPGSHVIYNGDIYELEKISFTHPNSHIIDGKQAVLEAQLYHRSPETSKLLVLAVLMEVNEASSKSKIFWDNCSYLIPRGDTDAIVSMSSEWNIFFTIPESKSFYTYEGSIFNSPCSENVTWIVFSSFTNISDMSYKKIIEVIGENSRKVYPINNRTVQYNPNTSAKNNLNHSNPIHCLTDTELVEKCKKMFNSNGESQDNTLKRNKLMISVFIIITFLFVLIGVALYKCDTFGKLAAKLSTKVADGF
jgi:carbonic anhydrase